MAGHLAQRLPRLWRLGFVALWVALIRPLELGQLGGLLVPGHCRSAPNLKFKFCGRAKKGGRAYRRERAPNFDPPLRSNVNISLICVIVHVPRSWNHQPRAPRPNPPFSSAVFVLWHGRHRGCRLLSALLASSPSMWSTSVAARTLPCSAQHLHSGSRASTTARIRLQSAEFVGSARRACLLRTWALVSL